MLFLLEIFTEQNNNKESDIVKNAEVKNAASLYLPNYTSARSGL